VWLHASTQAVRGRKIANSVTYKIMLVGTTTVFLVGQANTLASVFRVANAALGADANFFTYSRNHRWSQGH
jgi:hypothetical protein